jgi:hypothetical protein
MEMRKTDGRLPFYRREDIIIEFYFDSVRFVTFEQCHISH